MPSGRAIGADGSGCEHLLSSSISVSPLPDGLVLLAEPRPPRRSWENAEVETLRLRYPAPTSTTADIAADLNRSVGSVRAKARRLGLRRPPRRKAPGSEGGLCAARTGAVFGRLSRTLLAAPTPLPVMPAPVAPAPVVPAPAKRAFRLTALGGREEVWDRARAEGLAQLWDEKFHHSTIGEALGVSARAVSVKAHRMSLPSRGKMPLSRDLARARTLLAAGPVAPHAFVDREGNLLERKKCNVSGILFYGVRGNRTSTQVKQLDWWENNRPCGFH